MNNEQITESLVNVLENMPKDWLRLTTHRLDIYNEDLAKVEFLKEFESLLELENINPQRLNEKLSALPTAFDYIRLGHPLSCILEWIIGKLENLENESVISFSSKIMPILAILRKNLINRTDTLILYKNELPEYFDAETLKNIYGYSFKLEKYNSNEIPSFSGSTILLTDFSDEEISLQVDFVIRVHPVYGSVALVMDKKNTDYISEIQHVRRRESIAMTPLNCLKMLSEFTQMPLNLEPLDDNARELAEKNIHQITNSKSLIPIGSCGLSIQYSIMMGLIHEALDNHKGKEIKLIVPPNCYGGTNDQARRAAACIDNVDVLDLPVDGDQNMVQSVEKVLEFVAQIDAVPFIIAEIPTNPRVEVPDLEELKNALTKTRKTNTGNDAIAPVFILDQTFCPNVKFLGDSDILRNVKTISYVSGSKFPSGGLCTAGYCVSNKKADNLMKYVNKHLFICDNIATDYQIDILSKQMPSMVKRIEEAYTNTREFVNHIEKTLPMAKINFVSEELAQAGFTPSVFSLDLPTKGHSLQEKEDHKRMLNHKLISLMINEIPSESKHCVSYGQLQGCYWTIPATSTQGTTKEGDKDYIVRVALSPDFDLDHHKRVFTQFCDSEL